jgi:hypothetical protein
VNELNGFECLGKFAEQEIGKGNRLYSGWLLCSCIPVTPLTYCSWLSLLSASRNRFHFRILHATFRASTVIITLLLK